MCPVGKGVGLAVPSHVPRLSPSPSWNKMRHSQPTSPTSITGIMPLDFSRSAITTISRSAITTISRSAITRTLSWNKINDT